MDGKRVLLFTLSELWLGKDIYLALFALHVALLYDFSLLWFGLVWRLPGVLQKSLLHPGKMGKGQRGRNVYPTERVPGCMH